MAPNLALFQQQNIFPFPLGFSATKAKEYELDDFNCTIDVNVDLKNVKIYFCILKNLDMM